MPQVWTAATASVPPWKLKLGRYGTTELSSRGLLKLLQDACCLLPLRLLVLWLPTLPAPLLLVVLPVLFLVTMQHVSCASQLAPAAAG